MIDNESIQTQPLITKLVCQSFEVSEVCKDSFVRCLEIPESQLSRDQLLYFGLSVVLFFFKQYRNTGESKFILRETIFRAITEQTSSVNEEIQNRLLAFAKCYREYDTLLKNYDEAFSDERESETLVNTLVLKVTGTRPKGSMAFCLPTFSEAILQLLRDTKIKGLVGNKLP